MNSDLDFIKEENKYYLTIEDINKIDINVLSDFKWELDSDYLLYESCKKNNYYLLKKLIEWVLMLTLIFKINLEEQH